MIPLGGVTALGAGGTGELGDVQRVALGHALAVAVTPATTVVTLEQEARRAHVHGQSAHAGLQGRVRGQHGAVSVL